MFQPVEVNIAEMQDGGDNLEDNVLLLVGEPQHLKMVNVHCM